MTGVQTCALPILKTFKMNRKTGEQEPVYEIKFNVDFWKEIAEKEGSINVGLDEAHSLLNSRRSMSKRNIIMTDFLALLRRILGNDPSGYGELTPITQLERRIDVIAKEMATNIRFHRCHYLKTCKKCRFTWKETNDDPEPLWSCMSCGSNNILKHNHQIEVFHFANMTSYNGWKDFGMKTFHRHYFVNDIEKYFPYYNTLQWDNLLSEY